MKGNAGTGIKVCPRCGNTYHGASALSRQDGKTPFCPDCGVREALESLGVDETEQEAILATVVVKLFCNTYG